MPKSLKKSNLAHQRLVQVNSERYEKTGKELYQQRKLYHGLVKNLQAKEGRVFSQDEKKRSWNRMISQMY